MQVFGLPGHLMRNGRAASRVLAAKTPNIEAERRRDAVARWLMARAAGLTAEAAARAVGASPSTLHRWRKRAAPLSRRPRRVRGPNRPEGLAAAIAPQARLSDVGQGQDRAARAGARLCGQRRHVGRILGDLIRRGRAPAAPDLLRKLGPRSAGKSGPYAVRKPKDVAFEKLGDVVQIDTLSISILPG